MLMCKIETEIFGRMLSDARQMCRVMTSHLITLNPTYNNKKSKVELPMVMYAD